MAVFRLKEFDSLDKRAFITVDDTDVTLIVDTDDVDLFETATVVDKMLAILNEHWLDAKYTTLGPTGTAALELGERPEDDDEFDEYWERKHEKAREILRRLSGRGE